MGTEIEPGAKTRLNLFKGLTMKTILTITAILLALASCGPKCLEYGEETCVSVVEVDNVLNTPLMQEMCSRKCIRYEVKK